jgi:integrase
MADKPKIPTVRMAKAGGRPIQLRYTCPETGKEIRLSTGTYDPELAAEQKKDLEAKLRLGISPSTPKGPKPGPDMFWEDFREKYTKLHTSLLREKSRKSAESRLDIAEEILKPKRLSDVASSEALALLQARLKAKRTKPTKADEAGRPLSRQTVRSYMIAFIGALNWACDEMGWLPMVPKIKLVKTSKLKQMKGRPITVEEFDRMIAATADVVGEAAAPSWRYLLRGLWSSGLRLGEIMNVHWTDQARIVPHWPDKLLPVLLIPADLQKNDTSQAIPLVPDFERLLLQTPDDQRNGFVFNPLSLQGTKGRKASGKRLSADWAGKILVRIGHKAGVLVEVGGEFRRPKTASAQDMRRSFGANAVRRGIPMDDLRIVLRHADRKTTEQFYVGQDVQRSGESWRSVPKTGRYTRKTKSS